MEQPLSTDILINNSVCDASDTNTIYVLMRIRINGNGTIYLSNTLRLNLQRVDKFNRILINHLLILCKLIAESVV